MNSDIVFASNIVLPCAVSKSEHAARKAELDTLVAAVAEINERLEIYLPITSLETPVINSFTHTRQGAGESVFVSVNFTCVSFADSYVLEVYMYSSHEYMLVCSFNNYVSGQIIALERYCNFLDGDLMHLSIKAKRGNVYSQSAVTADFSA